MVRKIDIYRLLLKRAAAAEASPPLPSAGEPVPPTCGSDSSNSDGTTGQNNPVVEDRQDSEPEKNAVEKEIVTHCPQCGVLFNASKYRKVTETCGHSKCRNCIIMTEDGCSLCNSNGSSPPVVSDMDGNFHQYIQHQYINGPLLGGAPSSIVGSGSVYLPQGVAVANELQYGTNSIAHSVYSGRSSSSSPSYEETYDAGRQSPFVYADLPNSDYGLSFPTAISGRMESDEPAVATIDLQAVETLTAPNLETEYMSIPDYSSTVNNSYTSLINADSEFTESSMSLRTSPKQSFEPPYTYSSSIITLGTTSNGGLVTRAQLKELPELIPISPTLPSSPADLSRTISPSGSSSSSSRRQYIDNSQVESDQQTTINSNMASGGRSSRKGNTSGATQAKGSDRNSPILTRSRLNALLAQSSSSKCGTTNDGYLLAPPLSNTSTTLLLTGENVVQPDFVADEFSTLSLVGNATTFTSGDNMRISLSDGNINESGDTNNNNDVGVINIEYQAGSGNAKPRKKRGQRLPRHIAVLDKDPIMYQCNVCLKKFKTKRHISYHEFCQKGVRPFQCQHCGQGFIAKSHYEYHLRTHTGERPYICPKCGKGFNQRGKVTRHMRSHKKEKPYVCQHCYRGFANAQVLRSHTMIHAGEKPFGCEYCTKRFAGTPGLKKHLIVHTGKRPFECMLCGKRFGLKCTLEVHVKTHSGERPFPCDHCSTAFTNMKDLRRHLVIHSGERPFKCWICGIPFRRKDNLDRHIKHKHKQPKEVAMQLSNEAAAEYLKQQTNTQSIANIPISKVNSIVILSIIKNADLIPHMGLNNNHY